MAPYEVDFIISDRPITMLLSIRSRHHWSNQDD
jgi:hypothetical protein